MAEAELKTGPVTQANAGVGAVARTQTVTYTEAVAMTRDVGKMEAMTKSHD